MPTFDLKPQVGQTREQSSRAFEFKKTIDFSEQNLGAGDDGAFITMDEGSVVTDVYSRIVTAEGGVATFNVGDAADPNGFIAAANANSAANTLVHGGGAYASNGKLYAAATDLSIAAIAAMDTAVVEVIVKGYMIDL